MAFDISLIPLDEEFVDGEDFALERGLESYRQFVLGLSIQQGLDIGYLPWGGQLAARKHAAKAEIDFDRWIARCPEELCSGSEYVSLEDPFFFCLSCGNTSFPGKALPVSFPRNDVRRDIYRELLRRPMSRPKFTSRTNNAMSSQPSVHGLVRVWHPHETVTDLKRQRRALGIPDGDRPDRFRNDQLPKKRRRRVRRGTDQWNTPQQGRGPGSRGEAN